jgi:hypothetical protein
MLGKFNRNITLCKSNRPAKPDASHTKVDESGPESGPQTGPVNPQAPVFTYCS